jgi:DNA-directed RNA polymerase specialized sigma24 family protein
MSTPDLTGHDLEDLDTFAQWCYTHLPRVVHRRWPASDADDAIQNVLESCLSRRWFGQLREHANPTAFLLATLRNSILADGRRDRRRRRREERAAACREAPTRRQISSTLEQLSLADEVKQAILQMQREMASEGMSVYFAVFYEATILPLAVGSGFSHEQIAKRYHLSSRAVVGRAAASGRRRLAYMLGPEHEGGSPR